MNDIKITYILTTRNNLDIFKASLNNLLNNIQDYDEIIVVDRSSTDGTREYLNSLKNDNKIDQLIVVNDRGEASGFNTGILASQRDLILIYRCNQIINFRVLDKCRKLMTEDRDLHFLTGNFVQCDISNLQNDEHFNHKIISPNIRPEYYLNSSNHLDIRKFIGLPIIINKQSISLLGLLSNCVSVFEFDYLLRILSLNIKFECVNQVISCLLLSNGNKRDYELDVELEEETERVKVLYFEEYWDMYTSYLKKRYGLSAGIQRKINSIYKFFNKKFNDENFMNASGTGISPVISETEVKSAFEYYNNLISRMYNT